MRYSLRLKIFLAILVPFMLLVVAMGIYTTLATMREQMEFHERLRDQVEEDLVSEIRLLDASYRVIEGFLAPSLERLFPAFGAAYVASGRNPAAMDLARLKSEFGGEVDLYAIDSEGIIRYGTYAGVIGLDFKAFPDFYRGIQLIRAGRAIVHDRLSIELTTGRLRLWSYMPSDDGKWLLELGLSSDIVADRMGPLDVKPIAERLRGNNPLILGIKIYDRLGYPIDAELYGEKDIVDLVPEVRRKGSMRMLDEDGSSEARYLYVDLSTPSRDGVTPPPSDPSKILEIQYDLSAIRRSADTQLAVVAVVFGVIAVLVLLISRVLSDVITKPVLEINDSVRRFAAKDFDARSEVRGTDELAQLSAEVNRMADSIRSYATGLEELVATRTDELREEKEKSERLLLNILPARVAERLKEGADVIADEFAESAVLFADIVDFTRLSERLGPFRVVTLLNEVFTGLDRLAERCGLEKIKTIGDAYMVAAGVPEPLPDYADRMASFALEAMDYVAEFSSGGDARIAMRIGINSGPLVAGVIGTRKFIYDLWGDTVNTASRLESTGEGGKIHVSPGFAALCGSAFVFEDRGEVDLKGKGTMSTKYLVGRRA